MNMEHSNTEPVFREMGICLNQKVFEILYCHFSLLCQVITVLILLIQVL